MINAGSKLSDWVANLNNKFILELILKLNTVIFLSYHDSAHTVWFNTDLNTGFKHNDTPVDGILIEMTHGELRLVQVVDYTHHGVTMFNFLRYFNFALHSHWLISFIPKYCPFFISDSFSWPHEFNKDLELLLFSLMDMS